MTALDRRGFLGAAATTLAGARLGMMQSDAAVLEVNQWL